MTEPAKKDAAPESRPLPADNLVTSRHSARINGRTVNYTVTCGTVVLKEDIEKEGSREGEKPRATVFFTAYVKDGVKDRSKRPLTFAFNGGPGSSSVWVHLGLFGPRRVELDAEGNAPKPPYRLVDNEYSLLDESDLVFIDPVGTGYSRMVDGEKVGEFHNTPRDVESVGEFIRLYCSRNGRWASPKFIGGESYGTTRAAALSRHLQTKHGLYFNGLMLISCALEFGSLRFLPGHDLPHLLFFPTYALTARYHGKLSPVLTKKPLAAFVKEVEEFTAGEYSQALFKGDRLPAAERKALVKKLAAYSGLSESYIESTNLRINIHRFTKELLREQRRTVGRLDSRFQGLDRDAAGEHYEFDPAHANLDGAYAACINDYLKSELGYASDTPYTVMSPLYLTWDFGSKNEPLNVAEKLRQAMSAQPSLKVYVGQGYYDLATPHFAADYVMTHMGLDASLAGNIETHYYESGHMMYIHEPSLKAQAKHLREFVKRAS